MILHIFGFHVELGPLGAGSADEEATLADQYCDRFTDPDGLGWRLSNVVSSVFITYLKLFSRRKSVGRRKREKS
jgi:hypothetical protein